MPGGLPGTRPPLAFASPSDSTDAGGHEPRLRPHTRGARAVHDTTAASSARGARAVHDTTAAPSGCGAGAVHAVARRSREESLRAARPRTRERGPAGFRTFYPGLRL